MDAKGLINRFRKSSGMFSLLILILVFSTGCNKPVHEIDLSGDWAFSLDSLDVGVVGNWASTNLEGSIQLPGTTDDAGFGTPNTLKPALEKPQVLRLRRKNEYRGAAWYQKKVTIPAGWKDKNITLKLGRVLWESRLWVDGKDVGMQESLVTPHYYSLSEVLTPGEHILTIRVDNRKKHSISVREMGHAYTNETQIIWNGIIGDLTLNARDAAVISDVQIYPNVEDKSFKVVLSVHNYSDKKTDGTMDLFPQLQNRNEKSENLNEKLVLAPGENVFVYNYSFEKDIKLWDEFEPNLYDLNVRIKGQGFEDSKTSTFGMRNITNNDSKFQINGRRLFLRGTLECCIFPLTGHPPMDEAGWEKVFNTAKEWGLNHLRFHSWCPPEAAFIVADKMGFYLQVELPVWTLDIGKDAATIAFLKDEANRMIHEYGNHPSFGFWSLGNELQGDFDVLESMLVDLKNRDSRHLYCTTAYTFEKGHGQWPEPEDDYFTTQITKKGWVRGQGLFDSEYPSFDKWYTASIEGIPVALVSHEIGQYAVFPNLKEIEKYTGVLTPLNFMAVRKDMTEKGLLHRAEDYLMATGKFATILYKEEIERALKSDGLSGYQLLDLHDFPGQGTALVGLLDAFWDSKGVTTASEFRQFSSPLVPFANFPKAVYRNSEIFEAKFAIANYSAEDLKSQEIHWELTSEDGQFSKSGIISEVNIPLGVAYNLGQMQVPLNEIKTASQCKLSVRIGDHINAWDVWVYPEQLSIDKKDVVYTTNLKQAMASLDAGANVLFNPYFENIIGLEGKFVPVFWSPVHFPNQAGTMGLLCDPEHPAFNHFPTDFHSNWQWWDLCKQSRVVTLDQLPGVEPLLINVDNFNRNSSLASIFEAAVGEGKLLFCTMDLNSNLENRPVAKQLLYSLTEYMKSDAFDPKGNASVDDIGSFIAKESLLIDRGSIYDK